MTLVGKTHGNEFELQQVHVRWLCLWPRTCKKECREFEIQLFFFGMLPQPDRVFSQIADLKDFSLNKTTLLLLLLAQRSFHSCKCN